MALNLYLDDCADSTSLDRLLRQAGHTVVRPKDAGILGRPDDIHFAYALQHSLVILTKDPNDFLALHRQNPNHSGIFAGYQDNHLGRDMTPADIVAAVARIEAAVGYPIAGEFHNLNAWR